MSSRVLASRAKAADWTPALALRSPARDFSRVPARTGELLAKFSDDAATSGGGDTGTEKGLAGKAPATPQISGARNSAAPRQSAGTPINGKVTNVDVITGATGAVTDFPAVSDGGSSLDSPGPFNDTTTGACRNIHQMKFTVAGITSNELRLLRMIDRTSTVAANSKSTPARTGPISRPCCGRARARPSSPSPTAPATRPAARARTFPSATTPTSSSMATTSSPTRSSPSCTTVTIANSALNDAKPTNQIKVTKRVLK